MLLPPLSLLPPIVLDGCAAQENALFSTATIVSCYVPWLPPFYLMRNAWVLGVAKLIDEESTKDIKTSLKSQDTKSNSESPSSLPLVFPSSSLLSLHFLPFPNHFGSSTLSARIFPLCRCSWMEIPEADNLDLY
ncbi:unnamed protein product [Amaranthus hypochondriacus]